MAPWDQLSIDKPHLAYLIIGGFTSLFMLCSLFVKERLYIGEATVATICGIIFGPHAANLFDPGTWGNTDKITLECSRIVLVVQCFAVGVELPKSYMERHWRSVFLLLVPVMTFGWLVTSLFIWWMIEPLTWLESLCCAACVTATDPVLASSVVGKGKFSKRVPKHLRDLLSAESGCNDGMAFPFIYLSFYLIKFRPDASEVAFHWICLTVLYECIFGAVYGFLIGYFGRHAIKWADRKGLIDRESFLVFYFVLALFCAGSGSTLGIDDLLVGFSAGVGFSNDGWFTQKTEESHVSNVIDLLLNLTYFVFLGAIIPWQDYNAPEIGITPWRLVVIALMVIFFRRIPIMLALKPLVPDIKNWREALFAGHFGPIGVGAIFAAILTRAELESDSTYPLAVLPGPGSKNYYIIQCIWPITTFLVISSILVHGSSVAVFTLGKHINTLTLTMSYTQANEDGQSWMNRLPRIQSTARSSVSKSKGDFESTDTSDEKLPQYPPGALPPVGVPGNFLRRQREEDNTSNNNSRTSSLRPPARRRKWDSGLGPGGPISQSAITPQRRAESSGAIDSTAETLNEKRNESPDVRENEEPLDGVEMQEEVDKRQEQERKEAYRNEPEVEVYEEGNEMIIEDEEGTIIRTHDVTGESEEQKKQHITDAKDELRRETSGQHAKDKYHPHAKNEGEDFEKAVAAGLEHPGNGFGDFRKRLADWHGWNKIKEEDNNAGSSKAKAPPEHHRGPAHAYQYGNTIIVEDEDGEVVKKYDIPAAEKRPGTGRNITFQNTAPVRERLHRIGTWAHVGGKGSQATDAQTGGAGEAKAVGRKWGKSNVVDDDDDRIRFTVNAGGERMRKEDFIKQIRALDPKARCEVVQESDVHDDLKHEVRQQAKEHHHTSQHQSTPFRKTPNAETNSYPLPNAKNQKDKQPEVQKVLSNEDRPTGDTGLTLVDSNGDDIPYHSVPETLSKYSTGQTETAAQRRRRLARSRKDSEDDGTERIPPLRRQDFEPHTASSNTTTNREESSMASRGETAAERRRRLAALGEGDATKDSDSDDDGGERQPKPNQKPVEEPTLRQLRTPGIRFADSPSVSQSRVQWGEDVNRRGRGR